MVVISITILSEGKITVIHLKHVMLHAHNHYGVKKKLINSCIYQNIQRKQFKQIGFLFKLIFTLIINNRKQSILTLTASVYHS